MGEDEDDLGKNYVLTSDGLAARQTSLELNVSRYTLLVKITTLDLDNEFVFFLSGCVSFPSSFLLCKVTLVSSHYFKILMRERTNKNQFDS